MTKPPSTKKPIRRLGGKKPPPTTPADRGARGDFAQTTPAAPIEQSEASTGRNLHLVRSLIAPGKLTGDELDKALKFCARLVNGRGSNRDKNNAAKTIVAATRIATEAELAMHRHAVAADGAAAGEAKVEIVVRHVGQAPPAKE